MALAKAFEETEEYKRGHHGEHLVASMLKSMGWWVVPTYDYVGEGIRGAPKMRGKHDGFVLPDLDVSKGGDRRWVEVKTKTEPTLTRIRADAPEHGIDAPHYRDYLRVQEETATPVWLAIVEECSNTVLWRLFDDLRKLERNSPNFGRNGGVFFPRSAFEILGKF